MDVTEQPALFGDLEPRPRLQPRAYGRHRAGALRRAGGRTAAADEAARAPADRRDADRVFEQPPRRRDAPPVRQVAPERRGTVSDDRRDDSIQPGMCDLAGEEVEETLQLVGIPAERGRQLGRVGALGGLDRSHVELKLVAVALHAAEHAHGVALGEPAVQEIDVVPDPASMRPLGRRARARDSRRRRACAAAVFAPPRTSLDDAVFSQVDDSRHGVESRAECGW